MCHYIGLFLITPFFFVNCTNHGKAQTSAESSEDKIASYTELNQRIIHGWNTWDNRNVLSHVLLPEEISLHLQIEDSLSGELLKFAFTGNYAGKEVVRPLAHTPDGSYTALQLSWGDFNMVVQSVSKGEHLDVLISPKFYTKKLNPGYLLAEIDFPYDRKGEVRMEDGKFQISTGGVEVSIYMNGNSVKDPRSVKMDFKDYISFSTRKSSIDEVQERIKTAEASYWLKKQEYGHMSEVYNVIQNAINWNVVYDPVQDRAVTPVARTWSYGWGHQKPGGYVQFCWDNFFAAYMHAIESPELACNEVIQLTNLVDELGFVPNFAGPGQVYSRDRSQPPVGSMMVREIYKMHPNRWFLETTFQQLLRWNRWWKDNRDIDGYLAWGSNPFENVTDRKQATQNNFAAAVNESGLDNSPMYDSVPFDTSTHLLLQADVGLMGMYIADCEALADIAIVLGELEVARELDERGNTYREKLKKLWNDEFGMFLNKRIDTKEWNYSISPTNFYALLGRAATQEQAKRMIDEHFYNPKEFFGDYMLPSIARNDPGYTGRDYWRGSIWAPMNFLVYLGMRNYELPKARKEIADKSKKLLLKNWDEHSFVLENYSADYGGHPGYRSEYFYHWGALLGMINLIEFGYVPPTETSIN